jgi:hypothetical protein
VENNGVAIDALGFVKADELDACLHVGGFEKRVKREGIVNAWTDANFKAAVEATGRKNPAWIGVGIAWPPAAYERRPKLTKLVCWRPGDSEPKALSV